MVILQPPTRVKLANNVPDRLSRPPASSISGAGAREPSKAVRCCAEVRQSRDTDTARSLRPGEVKSVNARRGFSARVPPPRIFAPRWYIQPEKWSLGAESFEDAHTGRAGYRGKEMEAMKQRALHLRHELQGLYISRQLKTYMRVRNLRVPRCLDSVPA